MATNTGELGGYDLNFVSEPPDTLTCLICTFVARDPQQMDCCGRVYCQLCLSEQKEHSNNKCPYCREVGNSFKDKRSAREIEALLVECTSIKNGCQWVNELSCLEDHLNVCEYALVPCTNECQQDHQFLRKDLKDHLDNDCPRRLFKCPHCNDEGEYEEITGAHLATCRQISIECSNDGCEETFPRWMISTHLTVCEHQPVSCRYAEIGCKVMTRSKDIKKHEEDANFHFQLMAWNFLKLKTDMRKLDTEVSTQRKEIVQLKNQMYKITPLTLRIEGFEKHKRNDHIYYSAPFYTSKLGYKLCIRIDCNGNGDGRGTHVSVFVCFMKGDNDDSLTWPFIGTVKIELLNQLKDKNHHKITVIFQPDSPYGRRVTTEQRRVGLAYSFIPHRDLHFKPKNCQYLKDDTLIFRVSVQIPGYKPWLESTDHYHPMQVY